jgi:hypothetical protein
LTSGVNVSSPLVNARCPVRAHLLRGHLDPSDTPAIPLGRPVGRVHLELENEVSNLKKALLATALLSMGACSSVAISDIATDKVKVESMNADPKAVMAEAEHGCAIYNRVPVALSKRALPSNGYIPRYEHLFACMDPTQANAIPRIASK